ncbi:MAG: Ig-like domain-containing protein [Longimicrobiales bacterium]
MQREEAFAGRWVFRLLAALSLLVGVLHTSGCARPGRPSGGPEDRIPPMVIDTRPDTFRTIDPTRDPVVFTFSERISERPTQGRMSEAVLVSPETGVYEVKHKRSALEVSVEGGWKAGLVYRVRVLNTVKDLFNNPMEGPFELVFSTGGAYESHVLAGVVTDRISGEKVEGARVEAREVIEGEAEQEGEESPEVPVYVARTDSAGIYMIRYIPSGRYDISIFRDNNRNREPDYTEVQGTTTAHFGLLAPRADTLIREVALLRPDTIPAELARVEAVDSALIELIFDDFLPTESSLSPVRLTLSRDTGSAPGVERLLWPRQLDSLRAFEDSVRVADSLRIVADSLRVVADSLQGVVQALEAAGDTVELPEVQRALERLEARLAPPEPETPEEEEEAPAPEPILPQPSFFAILQEALEPNQPYQVLVDGVRNINGLGGGGGEATVTWEPPEPPPGDTTGALPDSLLVPPDTASVPPDTGGVAGRALKPGISRLRLP